MKKAQEYRNLVKAYNERVHNDVDLTIPFDRSDTAEDDILVNLEQLETKLRKKIPVSYKEYLQYTGGSGFKCGTYMLYLDKYKHLLEFNIGTSRHEEMQDYLIFGSDGGDYIWFFDSDNKMGMGNEAIFVVELSALSEDAFIFRALNFKELLRQAAYGTELPDEYFLKPHIATEAEALQQHNTAEALLSRIDNAMHDAQNTKLRGDIESILNILGTMDKKKHKKGYMEDDEFSYCADLESELNRQLPINYLCLLNELRGGFCKSQYFHIDLFISSDILEANIGKKREKILSGFFVFAQSGFMNVFIDIDNKLGKGANAIFRLDFDAKTISEAVFLSTDFVDLFRMLAEDTEPNKIPIGMYNEK